MTGAIAMGLGGHLAARTDPKRFQSEVRRVFGEVDDLRQREVAEVEAVVSKAVELKFTCQAWMLVAGFWTILAAIPASADPGKLAMRGKHILQEKCGRCHAVEAVGDSPLKSAPPMRDVYARYAPRELQAELLEGMVSRHKEMPQIEFSEEDVDAILAYLYLLAVAK